VGPVDCDQCDYCDPENDIDYNFVTDILPWAIDAAFVTSQPLYNGQVGTFVLSWNEVGQALDMACTSAPANNHGLAIAQLPEPHLIRPGDHFQFQFAVTGGTITYVAMVMDAAGTILASAGAGTTTGGTESVNLEAAVGQEIHYFGIRTARASTGSYTAKNNYIRVVCV